MNALRVPSIPSSRSLVKVLNRSSPSAEPWGAALVSGSQMANPAVCVRSWLGPCLKTKLAGPKQGGGRRAMAWELSLCLSAHQAQLPLLHPSMGTAPAGVSSGTVSQGNSPPSARACCPSPQQCMVLGSTGELCETPSASCCTKECRERGTLGLVVAAEGHGHLWCPILPQRRVWGAGGL